MNWRVFSCKNNHPYLISDFPEFVYIYSFLISLCIFCIVSSDMGEQLPAHILLERFKKFDLDNSGTIDFKEFVLGTFEMMQNSDDLKERTLARTARAATRAASIVSMETEDEEEPEMPDDLTDLSPEEQQYRVKVRSSYLMALGTTLVLLFSDPMVDVLNEIGVRLV